MSVVLREVTVGRPVWESRRLLDQPDAGDTASFVDEFLRDRAGQSLAHVFTLLSLVLPKEPLQIAFRGLYIEDRNLQGTALEYLEGILPRRSASACGRSSKIAGRAASPPRRARRSWPTC